jgi:L-ascorbate metabolism protein UlaG (beta-lactamase superfamily)
MQERWPARVRWKALGAALAWAAQACAAKAVGAAGPAAGQRPAALGGTAWASSPRRLYTAPELYDAPEEWIERSLDWVEFISGRYAPGVVETPVRRAALIRLDDILHIESAPSKPVVQAFYRRRMERAVAEIERTRVERGMRIWKLYNHGFFIRTESVSFAFDVVRGTRVAGFSVPAGLIERLARQAGALFISHRHDDHADVEVARAFAALGKPVLAPEVFWPELAGALTIVKRGLGPAVEVPVAGHRAIRAIAYPGHQDDLLNNVYLVETPERLAVMHTGDQYDGENARSDFDWLSRIGQRQRVDVLLPNCWANGLERMIEGARPRLVITGHENEMGHTVAHREDYTQTYNRLFGVRCPALVMGWGESYLYVPETDAAAG